MYNIIIRSGKGVFLEQRAKWGIYCVDHTNVEKFHPPGLVMTYLHRRTIGCSPDELLELGELHHSPVKHLGELNLQHIHLEEGGNELLVHGKNDELRSILCV
nr:MAG: hypothetical protein [Seabass toti-like virus]